MAQEQADGLGTQRNSTVLFQFQGVKVPWQVFTGVASFDAGTGGLKSLFSVAVGNDQIEEASFTVMNVTDYGDISAPFRHI